MQSINDLSPNSFLSSFSPPHLDNILIYSKLEEEYIFYVHKVLERLYQASLQVNIKKSEFYVTYTRYLRYVLIDKGLEVDSNNVKAPKIQI